MARAEAAAQRSEGPVRHAGHRRHEQVVRQDERAEAQRFQHVGLLKNEARV
jgi:hypothetical protein